MTTTSIPTTSLDAWQRKVQWLEEQNNSLKLTIRRQESEIGRLQVRTQQGKDAHKVRILEAAVKELQARCDAAESEETLAHQRLAAFQHETFTLRSLVKLADHPELADAARAEAERLIAREEVRHLKEQLRRQQQECEAYRTRCVEACDTAERLSVQVRQWEAGKMAPMPCAGAPVEEPSVTHSTLPVADERGMGLSDEENTIGRSYATFTGARDASEETAQLRRELSAQQQRCAALEEALDAMRAAKQAAPTATHRGERKLQKLAKLARITKGENALLTSRVTNLIAQNRQLLSRQAALEEEAALLRFRAALLKHPPVTGEAVEVS